MMSGIWPRIAGGITKNKATATSRQEQRPGLLLTQTHWEGGQRGAGSRVLLECPGATGPYFATGHENLPTFQQVGFHSRLEGVLKRKEQ